MKETLDMAVEKAHVRPRVLSDNEPCYLARERKDYLDKQEKIDRSRLYFKTILNVQHYYTPEAMEKEIAAFMEYYNNHRYHEPIKTLSITKEMQSNNKQCNPNVKITRKRKFIQNICINYTYFLTFNPINPTCLQRTGMGTRSAEYRNIENTVKRSDVLLFNTVYLY